MLQDLHGRPRIYLSRPHVMLPHVFPRPSCVEHAVERGGRYVRAGV